MAIQHKNLAPEKWHSFSLMEQLGNIGSEVGRARRWMNKDKKIFEGAVERALELFDLTLEDQKLNLPRRTEIARAREVFVDALYGGKEYKSSLEDLEKYLSYFAFAARKNA